MEHTIYELLTGIGFKRPFAKTLDYLVTHGESFAQQIEEGSHIRQPEASLALKQLFERKWVLRVVEDSSRGRPRIIYKAIDTDSLFEMIMQSKEGVACKHKIESLRNLKAAMISPKPAVNESSTKEQQHPLK